MTVVVVVVVVVVSCHSVIRGPLWSVRMCTSLEQGEHAVNFPDLAKPFQDVLGISPIFITLV